MIVMMSHSVETIKDKLIWFWEVSVAEQFGNSDESPLEQVDDFSAWSIKVKII